MKVKYITSDVEAKQALLDLEDSKKIALDTETTGLDSWVAKLRLVQMCSAEQESEEDKIVYVFDMFKISSKPIKTYIESRETLVIHNANFDLQFLYSINCDYKNRVFCTFIAEKVLRAGFKERKIAPKTKKPYFADISCSLKAVAERRLGLELDKEQQVSDWSADELNEEQIKYSAKDVLVLPLIARQQLEELKEENLLSIYSLESQCIRPVAMMCRTGFNVDIQKLKDLKIKVEKEVEEKTHKFVLELNARLPDGEKLPKRVTGEIAVGKDAKKEFNPGSTQQVIRAFQLCGIAVPLSKTTEKPTLNQVDLAEFDSDDTTLNLYRDRAKSETRLEHVEKLLANVNPISHRMHSGYNQYGANSGRFTSSGAPKVAASKIKSVFGVNIQQVPRSKDFRSAFITTPGFKLIICDWAQIELRLGAELVNIPQMKQAFKEKIDLHTMTASLIYKKDVNEVSKDERQDGKTLNFALLYGMGYRKYKTYAAQSGKLISLSEAKVAHTAFHAAYPRLREWHKERAALVADGWAYVRTACGRRRLLSYDDATMMCSANTLIQGSGADILKIAISKLNQHLNDDARMVACVHDEIVLEVKEELAEDYKRILEEAMISAAEVVLKTVPAEADAGIGLSWADK
jgi:DNA polymerase I-like protein with 3'-5' exonuclease and polymerase domains